MQLRLLVVGKSREKWLIDAIDEYTKRLEQQIPCHLVALRDDEALIRAAKAAEKPLFALDPRGELMDSPAFAAMVMERLQSHRREIVWIIGGPEGLPSSIRQEARLISFSPMTFTHQCIRLLLVEQLYRAFEIIKGSPYHK